MIKYKPSTLNVFIHSNFKEWIIYTLCALVLLTVAPMWVFLSFLFTLVFFRGTLFLVKFIRVYLIQRLAYAFCVLVSVIILSVTFKLFFIELYRVPSASMEGTLYPEDIILVNKLVYGPQLPQFLKNTVKSYFSNEGNIEEVQRLKGIHEIKQGDVMVYRTTKSHNVKRCMGLPGDDFQIIGGEVYSDGIKFSAKPTFKDEYKFETDKLNTSRNTNELSTKRNKSFVQNLSLDEATKIRASGNVKAITRVLAPFDSLKSFFCNPKGSKWTLDNMGPFKIPFKGMKVELDAYAYEVYKKVIETSENSKLLESQGGYSLNEDQITSYIFKEDYVFFMGDNRKNSTDSRYTGFQPLSSVVGKVELVLYSRNENRFRWERLVKRVL